MIKNPPNSSSNNWLNTLFLKKPSLKLRDKILIMAHRKKIFLRPVMETIAYFKTLPKNAKNEFRKFYCHL